MEWNRWPETHPRPPAMADPEVILTSHKAASLPAPPPPHSSTPPPSSRPPTVEERPITPLPAARPLATPFPRLVHTQLIPPASLTSPETAATSQVGDSGRRVREGSRSEGAVGRTDRNGGKEPSAGGDSGTFRRTLFLSSSGVDKTIPSLAGELWEQMVAAAVSSTRSPGGGRGSGLFSLS